MESDTIQCKYKEKELNKNYIIIYFNFSRFLRWAISVYSRAGHAAYEAMKGIMRLPSISTIKNYINESQQHSGWQNKTAYHILEKMAVENIGNHC